MNNYLKTTTFFIFIGIISLSIFMGVLSCDKSESNTVVVESINENLVSGVWEFILIPDITIPDTTLVKGKRGTDFEEYSTSFSDIVLYQNAENEIEGENSLFFFKGSVSNENVNINVYQHPDGYAHPDMEISEMNHVSSMELMFDDFGRLTGSGTFTENNTDPQAVNETYKVRALKTQDITNYNQFKDLKFDIDKVLCDLGSSAGSFIISVLSDDVLRPISDCFLHKEGGGYYVFGHEGPGSILPIYTQTFYYPYEWSFCGVKKYTFKMKLESEVTAIEDVLWAAENDKPSSNYFEKLGFNTLQDFKDQISDFHSKYGEFGITFIYSDHTNDIGLYVNHKSDKKDEVLEHELITKMESAIKDYGHKFYKKGGKDIDDDWYLRRSEAGVCNTPLTICYVVGTNNVKYE